MLPKEIQLMVWSFAIPKARLILLEPRCRYRLRKRQISEHRRRDIEGMRPKITNPAMLSANRDSRQVASKVYSLAFAFHFGHPTYFDFERDSIGICDPYTLLPGLVKETPINSELAPEYDQLRSLATLTNFVDPFEDFEVTALHIFTNSCLCFIRLKMLVFSGPLKKPLNDIVESEVEGLTGSAGEEYKAPEETGILGTTLAGEKIADLKAPTLGFSFVKYRK